MPTQTEYETVEQANLAAMREGFTVLNSCDIDHAIDATTIDGQRSCQVRRTNWDTFAIHYSDN